MGVKTTLFADFIKVRGELSVENVAERIRTGMYADKVNLIRQLRSEGRDREADEQKRTLDGVTFSATYRQGGRSKEYITGYNDVMSVDIDKLPQERMEPVRKALEADTDCTFLLTLSPSGNGYKLVCRPDSDEMRRLRSLYLASDSITYARLEEYHKLCFEQVRLYYREVAQVEIDASCNDIGRLVFLSYDPQAWLNTELLDRIAAPRLTIVTDGPEHPAEEKNIPVAPVAPATAAEALPELPVCSFVKAFLDLNTWRVSNRNNTLFRLCCEASKRGYKAEELLHELDPLLADATFDSAEIIRTVNSAYCKDRTDKPSVSGENRPVADIYDKSATTSIRRRVLQEIEDDIAEGESYREATPLFPDRVFEHLPDFIREGLRVADTPRERDMLLVGIITGLSSILPKVTGYYARKCYSPHLLSFVVGTAASGKGIVNYGLEMLRDWHDYVQGKTEKTHKEWEQQMENYETETANRKRKGLPACLDNRPEEVPVIYPVLPSTISKSRLIMHLRDNKDYGGLMYESEADSFVEASSLECGQFSDMVRKAFHHEKIDSSYKANGRPIIVRHPRLAMMLTGTPNQFSRFFHSSKNGFYSRVLFYTTTGTAVWKDVSPGKEEEDASEKLYAMLSTCVCRYARFLEQNPTRVTLSPRQWKTLNKTFSGLLHEADLEDSDDFLGVVKRHGLMTLRICMVLSALRKALAGWTSSEIRCTDEDFDTAMSIVGCCLEHSRLLLTSLHKDTDELPLHNPMPMQTLLESLPREFTTAEAILAGQGIGASTRQVYRYLHRALGFTINQATRGKYIKIQ